MTSTTEHKHFRRLHAPHENRAVEVHPNWTRVSDLVRENISLKSQPDYDFHGRKLSEIRTQSRIELLHAAQYWTAAYRDIDPIQINPPGLIFIAGHQPQMFHPGVWFKNFALGHLANRHHATAINLIIDSDAVSTTSLRVPGGSAANPTALLMPFDRPNPAIPFEERRIEDRELFESFGQRVTEQIAQLIPNPLIETFWATAVRQSHATDRLGASIAQARHIQEAQWGLATLEIPQSHVCELNAFHWFAAHLLSQIPKFSAVYNEAVREYRRLYRIRSTAHPVPDLVTENEWFETPFWIWSQENPMRKRLFAKHESSELLLTDRQAINERLPLTDQSDNGPAVEKLEELCQRGIKIRSRALITTLWARLVLGDLFIHGIGGGNYDLVTDRIIERFFHQQPPGFMILSATLYLPIPPSHICSPTGTMPSKADWSGKDQGEGGCMTADPTYFDLQLRELTYHPERFLEGPFSESKNMPSEVCQLIKSKQTWIDTPQTIENARTRCKAIRAINNSLQPYLNEYRQKILELRTKSAQQLHARQILTWREYGYCLYPESTLRTNMATLLPYE
jgi:hypothetical protein